MTRGQSYLDEEAEAWAEMQSVWDEVVPVTKDDWDHYVSFIRQKMIWEAEVFGSGVDDWLFTPKETPWVLEYWGDFVDANPEVRRTRDATQES